MSDYSTTPVKRSRTTRSDLLREPREELVERCLKMQGVIEQLSAKPQSDDLVQLKEMNDKLRAESSQREGILVMRLTAKEQEVQDLLTQLQDTKQSLCPGSSQLQSMLLDPAVNLLFESFKKELDESKAQLKVAQDDLAAYKFTPDSHIGKRLMAKCRLLLNENEELGRTISSGSVAKLESTIAIEKKLSQEMRKAEKDTEYALHELSDDMEAMQSTIYQLQQNLKETSEQLHQAQEENRRLRATLSPGTTVPLAETPGPGHGTPEGATPTQVKQRTDSNTEDLNRLKRTAPPSPATTNPRLKSRHTDKTDASAERTNYKSGGSARNRGTGSHGNQDRATAKGSGGRTGHHVRQGCDPPSESRTPSGTGSGAAAVTTRQDEPSNGRHANAESVAMDTNESLSATENSRSTNERENQRPRTGNNSSSSSKMDSASSELANGLVGKHSTLTDAACQKV